MFDTSTPPEPFGLTVAQYAQRWQVSVPTVRGWIRSGLPVVKVERVVRVIVAEADDWMRRRSAPAAVHGQRRTRARRPPK
jgi:hypothetical protein